MRSLVLIVCAIAAFSAASADASPNGAISASRATLLERALDLSVTDQETRPTGQCIVSCGDRMVTLERCPDGDCPEFDCRTGAVSCGSR